MRVKKSAQKTFERGETPEVAKREAVKQPQNAVIIPAKRLNYDLGLKEKKAAVKNA